MGKRCSTRTSNQEDQERVRGRVYEGRSKERKFFSYYYYFYYLVCEAIGTAATHGINFSVS
jgi:hypothetical protein